LGRGRDHERTLAAKLQQAFGHRGGDPPRSGARCRHAGGGRLHGGGPAPRPRRRSAQRRVGHRGSPRLLLRPPYLLRLLGLGSEAVAAARAQCSAMTAVRSPAPCAPARPRHDRRRRRLPPPGGGGCGVRGTGTGRVQPGRVDRRLLAALGRRRLGGAGAARRCGVRPGLTRPVGGSQRRAARRKVPASRTMTARGRRMTAAVLRECDVVSSRRRRAPRPRHEQLGVSPMRKSTRTAEATSARRPTNRFPAMPTQHARPPAPPGPGCA